MIYKTERLRKQGIVSILAAISLLSLSTALTSCNFGGENPAGERQEQQENYNNQTDESNDNDDDDNERRQRQDNDDDDD